ncbi:MAG: hypothetical protein OSA99_00895 [Acidimicrobiales bacterium]|nr:hypothetical protein [Acidimicrobiales bacterium]
MTPTAATELAEAVVEDGFGDHRPAVAALLAGARGRGVCETLIGIAADPSAPTVARERALGKIVVQYVAACADPTRSPAEPSVVCGTAA